MFGFPLRSVFASQRRTDNSSTSSTPSPDAPLNTSAQLEAGEIRPQSESDGKRGECMYVHCVPRETTFIHSG